MVIQDFNSQSGCVVLVIMYNPMQCSRSTYAIAIGPVWFTHMILTTILNISLTIMITYKLWHARKAVQMMGDHMTKLQSHYTFTMNVIIESSLAWCLSIILYLLSYYVPPKPGPTIQISDLHSLFAYLLRVTIVSWFHEAIQCSLSSFEFQMLCPAMLLYRIAHRQQYTPAESTSTGPSSQSTLRLESQWEHKQVWEFVLINEEGHHGTMRTSMTRRGWGLLNHGPLQLHSI
jgi:hypothetical protein